MTLSELFFDAYAGGLLAAMVVADVVAAFVLGRDLLRRLGSR